MMRKTRWQNQVAAQEMTELIRARKVAQLKAPGSLPQTADERSDLCEHGPLFQINQVDQVTHIFHAHDFPQFKFDPEGTFHLVD